MLTGKNSTMLALRQVTQIMQDVCRGDGGQTFGSQAQDSSVPALKLFFFPHLHL